MDDMQDTVSKKKIYIIVLFSVVVLLSLAQFFLYVSYAYKYTLDDAFITLRYSRNLVDYCAPVYNLGSFDEGYTSFFHVLFNAIPFVFHFDEIVWLKITGVFFSLCYYSLTGLWVFIALKPYSLSLRLCGTGFGLLCYSSLSSFTYHALSGLETPIFISVFILLQIITFIIVRDQKSSTLLLAVYALCSLLLGLIRPEGNLLAVIMIVMIWWLCHSVRTRLFYLTLALYFLPGITYFLWRWNYFGLPFPLPFYIKVADTEWAGTHQVLNYFVYMLGALGVYSIIGIHCIKKSLIPSIAGGVSLCLFYLYPEHIMGQQFRFLYPTLPLLLVLSSMGLVCLIMSVFQRDVLCSFCNITIKIIFIFLLVGFSIVMLSRKTYDELTTFKVMADGLYNAHIRLGKSLAEFDGKTVVVSDAGAIPYYSNLATIDSYGLNSKTIALDHDNDTSYIWNRNPDFIILLSSSREQFMAKIPYEKIIYNELLEKGYSLVTVMKYFPNSHYLWVYSNDQKLSHQLLDRLHLLDRRI